MREKITSSSQVPEGAQDTRMSSESAQHQLGRGQQVLNYQNWRDSYSLSIVQMRKLRPNEEKGLAEAPQLEAGRAKAHTQEP